MISQENPNRPIKASQTAFAVVEALERLGEAGPVELAEYLDLAPSTVHDHLATLVSLEYVQKHDQTYRLGLKFLQHGIYARNDLDFIDAAKEEADELAEQTGLFVWLYTEEYGRGVVVYKAAGENALETVGRVGWRAYLHTTSAGKAMLAHMPRERVEEIVEQHNLRERTDNTITSMDELLDALESIRDRGYAINDEENNTGIQAVGAPFLDEDGSVIGAISVSGPAHQITAEGTFEDLSKAVVDAANQIEVRLRYE